MILIGALMSRVPTHEWVWCPVPFRSLKVDAAKVKPSV